MISNYQRNDEFTIPITKALGLNEPIGGLLCLYPNPSTGSFSISTDGADRLILIEVSSAVIDSKVVTGDETVFDLPPHVKGIFVLKGQGLKASFVRRVVVE